MKSNAGPLYTHVMETVAADIMSKSPKVAHQDMTIEEALKLLVNSKITGMPVVDNQRRMVGVVSEYDVLEQISAAGKGNEAQTFRQKIRFSSKADAVREDTPLEEITQKFIQSRYRRLPVVDQEGCLVGIITRRDLIKVFYYRAKLL